MNRRAPLIALITLIFSIGVLVWYFFFMTPKSEPSLGDVSLPSSADAEKLPPRSGFINKVKRPYQGSTVTTEVTLQEDQPLIELWDKPSTGNTFINRDILVDIYSTSTVPNKIKSTDTSTSTATTTLISIKKTVHATSTIVMFVDRSTGHVYGANTKTGQTYQISNTTIPGVYDAYIFNNGNQILLRYLDNDKKTIISTLATIPKITEGADAAPLESILSLPKNITSVAVSTSGNKLSYLSSNNGTSYISTITSKGETLTATSPFSEWVLSYGGEQLYATTKPSAYIEGTTVLLPSFARIIGNKTGLISNPSPDGTIINSMLSSSGLISFIFSNRGETSVTNMKTLASKCSWGNNSYLLCAIPETLPQATEGLPDDWYQGRTQFNDSLYFYDIRSDESHKLFSFNSDFGEMDVTRINISSDNSNVSFVRKQDATLWLLRTNLLVE